MPRSRHWLVALMAVALLLGGCAGSADKTENKEQTELVKSLVNAASAALAQNDATTAVGYYRTALARDPKNVDAAVGLMQSLRLIGALDEARETAEKALAENPNNPGVAAEAGKVKLATGQLDDAIKLLKRAVAASDKDWRSRSALGLAYDRVAEYAKADQCYREALVISPDNAAVLNNYALSRAMANDLKGAQSLLQQAASAPDADMRVRQNLALIYALSGEMGKAEELARRDLPPALVTEELDYYRHLAATSRLPSAGDVKPSPALTSPDSSAVDILAPAFAQLAPQISAPAPAQRVAVAESALPGAAADAPTQALPPPSEAAATALPDDAAAVESAPAHAASPAIAVAKRRLAARARKSERSIRFTVQVATYLSPGPAERAVHEFALKGVPTRMFRIANRFGRVWFVVRSIEVETGAEADRLLYRVRALGCADALVVRRISA